MRPHTSQGFPNRGGGEGGGEQIKVAFQSKIAILGHFRFSK